MVRPYSEGNCVFKLGNVGEGDFLFLWSSTQCFSNSILSVYNLFKAEWGPIRAAQSSASGPHLLFLQIQNNHLTVSVLYCLVHLSSTCSVMFVFSLSVWCRINSASTLASLSYPRRQVTLILHLHFALSTSPTTRSPWSGSQDSTVAFSRDFA